MGAGVERLRQRRAACPAGWLATLREQPPAPGEWQHYAARLQDELEEVRDEAQLMRTLRLFRRETLVRIARAQAQGLCSTEETLLQLSGLAETLIVSARDWLYQTCCREWGTPCNAAGEPQPLLILGMGKLGGGELNFSSDIDLIFAYPETARPGRAARAGQCPVLHPPRPAADQGAGSADH